MPLLVYRRCNLGVALKIMGDATRGEEADCAGAENAA